MRGEWSEETPDLRVADGFDGRWEIHRQDNRWVAIPPDGCTYPYALIAPMMQATCLASVQHAAIDCMNYVYKTVGVKELRESGPAVTPASIHRQFVVSSCGIIYVIKQQTPEAPWVAGWSSWDQFGDITDASLPALIGRLREVLSDDVDAYRPLGLRAEILAEDQRIALRCWMLKQYSQASNVMSRLLEKGHETLLDEAIPGMAWAGRVEAYSLSLSQQADGEAELALRRPDDKAHYPSLSF